MGQSALALGTVRGVLERRPDDPMARALECELLLHAATPDERAALGAAMKGMAKVGACDTRLSILRLRCVGQVVMRELRVGGAKDQGLTERLMDAMRDVNTIATLTDGAGPLVELASMLLDVRPLPTMAHAELLVRVAWQRQPDRADLQLLLGRMILHRRDGLPEAVLEAWRRARALEPLMRPPPHYAAEFVAVHGDHPELRALVAGE